MLLTSSVMDHKHHTTHIKIWGARIYIINGRGTIKNLDDRSHHGYFMGYSATTGVIIYWKPEKSFSIHITHHDWVKEYNYCLYIEDTHTTSSLILQKYSEGLLHNFGLLNLISCKIDLTSTPIYDTKILTYEIVTSC